MAKITIESSHLIKLVIGTAVFSFALGTTFSVAQSQETFLGSEKFDRAQTMLLNLSHGKGSAGYFLLESERMQKEITHNLERALSQIVQVEKTYAKSKGKPDQKYLDASQLQLVNARQRSEELTEYISTTFRQMKRSVKETLLKP